MDQLKKKFSFDVHILNKTNTFLNDNTYYNCQIQKSLFFLVTLVRKLFLPSKLTNLH